MSAVALTEINYYMKIAIDINKKVGGTRAYGNSIVTQKPNLMPEIDFQSSKTTSIRTFIMLKQNQKKDKEEEAMPHRLMLMLEKKQKKFIIKSKE